MSETKNNNDGSEQETPVSEVNDESINESTEIANVSISSDVLSSLGLTRAIELADVTINGEVVQQNNGYSLSRETIFIPLTKDERSRVADYREQEAKYLKMGDLEAATLMGKLAKESSRRLLHEDVVGLLLAEPIFDEDGDIVETGGPLSRRKDVHFTWEEDGKLQTRMLISKDGKVSAFVRQDIADNAELVVANRQLRHRGDKQYQNAVKALALHENAVACDALDFVHFYNNEDGEQSARVNIPFDLNNIQKIAEDAVAANGIEGKQGASAMANLLG